MVPVDSVGQCVIIARTDLYARLNSQEATQHVGTQWIIVTRESDVAAGCTVGERDLLRHTNAHYCQEHKQKPVNMTHFYL